MKSPVLHFFYLLYCIEAGVFLCLAPWSSLWVRNSLMQASGFRDFLMTGQVRGGVTSLGILLLVIGAVDLVGFCRASRES